jgi:CheY-like chemotaxis protein
VISTDDSRERALQAGAAGFVTKPIQSKDTLDQMFDHFEQLIARRERRVLVIEPDAERREELTRQLGGDDMTLRFVDDGVDALEALEREWPFDCMITVPYVPDFEPASLAGWLEEHVSFSQFPVIVYGESSYDGGGWKCLTSLTAVRYIQSPQRLLDQVEFFLHRDVARLPEPRRRIIEELHNSDKLLAGRKVLIVDDDMRNIFALATVLEEHEMNIASADNGRTAIRMLQEDPDIEIVLMDIMMPEIDGLETIREVRKIPHHRDLPIVAVTAKAMKGDREKCIEAGAWDYLAKPVDTEQLLAVLRAWLHR